MIAAAGIARSNDGTEMKVPMEIIMMQMGDKMFVLIGLIDKIILLLLLGKQLPVEIHRNNETDKSLIIRPLC